MLNVIKGNTADNYMENCIGNTDDFRGLGVNYVASRKPETAQSSLSSGRVVQTVLSEDSEFVPEKGRSAEAAVRPDILFILADDMGYWAMGCNGNQAIKTPNLDRLAARGANFENFFCASPVCSPARASLLTGKIPSAHGVWDWIRAGNVDKDKLPSYLKEHQYFKDDTKPVQYLSGQRTYTEILRDNGYDVALCGKWHLGDSLTPQCGFENYWFTIARGGTSYMAPDVVEDGQISIREGEYLTDLITKKAKAYLEGRKSENKPFYLAVNYTAPHSPWDKGNHPEAMLELYKDSDFAEIPDLPLHTAQVPSAPMPDDKTGREDLLRGYYAAISAMDAGIGELLESVDLEKTLVIFMSDNGMNMGHHGIWGKGNGTYPANMYDTSVKIPCIISWPACIPEGIRVSAMHSQYDILPTLLDWLQLSDEAVDDRRPGRSLVPSLNNEDGDGHVVVFDEYGPSRMIRNRKEKLIVHYKSGQEEYYDLERDPEEKCNLIAEPDYAPRIDALRAELESWYEKYVEPGLDGLQEDVKGFGQYDRGGKYNPGKNVHGEIPEKFHKI